MRRMESSVLRRTLSPAPQTREQVLEIRRRWSFETERAALCRMVESKLIGMKRLAAESDGAQRVGPVNVPLFANECVTAQPRLDPDLIAAACAQS